MDDIFVYMAELPSTVHEAVMPCADGYTIYLNAGDTRERQIKSYMHALNHIRNCDWEKSDVQEIERQAHEGR